MFGKDFIAGCVSDNHKVVREVGKRFPEFFKSSYHFILFIIIAISFSTRGSLSSFNVRNNDNLST